MKQSNDKKKPRKERVEERRRKSAHKPPQAVDEPIVGSNEPAQRQMQKEKVRDGQKTGRLCKLQGRVRQGGDCLMNAFLSRL